MKRVTKRKKLERGQFVRFVTHGEGRFIFTDATVLIDHGDAVTIDYYRNGYKEPSLRTLPKTELFAYASKKKQAEDKMERIEKDRELEWHQVFQLAQLHEGSLVFVDATVLIDHGDEVTIAYYCLNYESRITTSVLKSELFTDPSKKSQVVVRPPPLG